MNLFDMRKTRQEALTKAESILAAAETANRTLTPIEAADVDRAMKEVTALNAKIAPLEATSTLTAIAAKLGGRIIPGGPSEVAAVVSPRKPKVLSAEYVSDFFSLVRSGGRKLTSTLADHADDLGGFPVPSVNAALYEGSPAQGGYAAPLTVEQIIVPLAPQEMAIRKLATVVPTSMDVKIPIKSAHGTAAAKSEGDGTGSNLFGGTSPTLTQKTLSAHMIGDVLDVSWEALQDITFFQSFATDDIILAVQQFEEPKFISGSGTGEPEGVLTACDTTTAVSGLTLDGIYDLVATLNAIYHPGAAFLMARATSLYIRKLQRQANLFEPVFTRVNGQDYLLGYPCEYSAYMPDYSTSGHKPIVFGDWKRGMVVGDRGGAGINVKILDQPKAVEGITQLLAYRRTDSCVRRSEALKAYVLA